MFDKKIIYFLTAVEEGSFSAAGRKLFLSQSAISQHISLLEEELSVQLFDRTYYRPKLTEAGEYYYRICCQIAEQYKSMEKELKSMYHQTIKIGFTGFYENKDILLLINNFRKNNPSIDISFVEGNFEDCIDNLINNKVDVSFGLESDFKMRTDIEYKKLHIYSLCIICSFDHWLAKYSEIDIEDIKNENFIVLSKEFGKGFYKDFMNAFKLDKIKPKIKKEVDSFDELIFNVSIGEGIAITSKNVVREADVKTVSLLNSHHHSYYAIGYRKESGNLLIHSFVEESIKHFQTL